MTEGIQPGHDYLIRVRSIEMTVRAIEFVCNLGLWRCAESRTGKIVYVPRAAFFARCTINEPSCRRPEWPNSKRRPGSRRSDSKSRPDSHVAI